MLAESRRSIFSELGWKFFLLRLGTDINYDKAFNWYKKSAEQGLMEAQLSLGVVYQTGKGLSEI